MAKKKSARNDRKTTSFKTRYGMTRAEWAKAKKEMRANGLGAEIDATYQRVRPK